MDDIYCLLQQIRKRPGLYIGKISLTALGNFLYGYTYRIITELWMKKTGLDFATDYDCFIRTSGIAEYSDCLVGFDEFVYAYYNVEMGAKNGDTVILENCQSEEEAFNKFYELLDAYFDEQHKKEKGDINDIRNK